MKKIKLMFAGLAVLAVVGGAFAFKAKNAFSTNIFYTTSILPVNCTSEFLAATTTTVATTAVYNTSVYYSTQSAASCAAVKAYITTAL